MFKKAVAVGFVVLCAVAGMLLNMYGTSLGWW